MPQECRNIRGLRLDQLEECSIMLVETAENALGPDTARLQEVSVDYPAQVFLQD